MKSLIIAALFLAPFAQADATPRAFYEVPVERELLPYAKYEITQFGKKVTGDVVEVSYVLPLELTGIPQVVKFSGKAVNERGAFELKGENGDMTCMTGTNDEANHGCFVKYRGIQVDIDEVAKILDGKRVSPEVRSGRLQVAALFAREGGDIGGIISYVYGEGHDHGKHGGSRGQEAEYSIR